MTAIARRAALALAGAAWLAGCGAPDRQVGSACVDEFQRNVSMLSASYGAPQSVAPGHGGGAPWSRTARFLAGTAMIELVAIYREAEAERPESCEIFAHYAKLDPDKAKELQQQAKSSH